LPHLANARCDHLLKKAFLIPLNSRKIVGSVTIVKKV